MNKFKNCTNESQFVKIVMIFGSSFFAPVSIGVDLT